MLRVLDKSLAYEVDQIRIVLPEELEDLSLEDGMDYCTLVTCTPYGVNSHRLLVRGHRIGNLSEASPAGVADEADADNMDIDGACAAVDDSLAAGSPSQKIMKEGMEI